MSFPHDTDFCAPEQVLTADRAGSRLAPANDVQSPPASFAARLFHEADQPLLAAMFGPALTRARDQRGEGEG